MTAPNEHHGDEDFILAAQDELRQRKMDDASDRLKEMRYDDEQL